MGREVKKCFSGGKAVDRFAGALFEMMYSFSSLPISLWSSGLSVTRLFGVQKPPSRIRILDFRILDHFSELSKPIDLKRKRPSDLYYHAHHEMKG